MISIRATDYILRSRESIVGLFHICMESGFNSKLKEVQIELLKGEKDFNTIVTENNIQLNLLRNWKKEFLNNASVVFDDKREKNFKEKLAEERKEKAAYAKKVG